MYSRFRWLGQFRIAPISRRGQHRRIREESKLWFKRGLIVWLALFTLLFQFSKRITYHPRPVEIDDSFFYFQVEDVPVTRQGVRKPPPPRPAVPIPVEEPSVPEDLTIEETELNFEAADMPLPEGEGVLPVIPPRPLADVFPEFPESERKRGVKGEIELAILVNEQGNVVDVKVLKNSTNSKKCEQAALDAAFRTKYLPAKKKEESVSVWIRKIYKFGS